MPEELPEKIDIVFRIVGHCCLCEKDCADIKPPAQLTKNEKPTISFSWKHENTYCKLHLVSLGVKDG
jgi:hypothetical protein